MPFCTAGCGEVVRNEDRHCGSCGAAQGKHAASTADQFVAGSGRGDTDDTLARMMGAEGSNVYNTAPCSECGKKIEGPEYTVSGRVCCKNCANSQYKCEKCGDSCKGGYIIVDDKKYHRACYNHDVKCVRCNGVLLADGIVAAGRNFHPDCFTCGCCNGKLAGTGGETQAFNVANSGAVYCKKTECQPKIVRKAAAPSGGGGGGASSNTDRAKEIHANIQQGKVRCLGCNEVITAPAFEGVSAKGGTYHQECLKCDGCGQALSDSYKSIGEKMYHSQCGPSSSPPCAGCNGQISGKFVRYKDQPYHHACFKCCVCAKGLSGAYAESSAGPCCPECVKNAPVHAGTKHTGERARGFKIDPTTGKRVFTS